MRWLAVLLLAGASAAAAEDTTRRDPFAFGGVPEPQASASPTPSLPGPALIGVLWDATRPLAVFGDEPVAAGQDVAGWRIVEILPDGIIVERNGVRHTLEPGQHLPPQ